MTHLAFGRNCHGSLPPNSWDRCFLNSVWVWSALIWAVIGSTASAQTSLNLIERFDPNTQRIAGRWQQSDGELRVDGDPASRVVLSDTVPTSYSLTVEFTRTDGENSVGVVLPVGRSQCLMVLSAFDGQAHGIGIVDGRLAKDNPTTIQPGKLETGHPYRLQIEVEIRGESASISSALDGRPFLNWTGNPSSLSMLDQWKLPSNTSLGLCTYASTTFHAVSLRPLVPAMRMTRAAAAAGPTPPAMRPNKTPTIESADAPSVAYSLAHGEGAIKPMAQTAGRLDISLQPLPGPITTGSLADRKLLVLRGPRTRISDSEVEAILGFVRNGNSLLVVMDEERRTSLDATGINRVVEPFGLSFTGDTPYLHNCGAIAKAGDLHDADREVPFSGGRSVQGGEPFGFQLAADGTPSEPYATKTQLAEGGGRVVLLSDGMASGLMGTTRGVRLTGVPRNPAKTTYWGKDSGVFMTEVIRWLLKRE